MQNQSEPTAIAEPPQSASDWARALTRYKQPSDQRAWLELVVTIVPYLLLTIGMFAALKVGIWLALVLALPTAGFLVRLFMIQHDCGHGSFFQSQKTNDLVGRTLGVLTLTPYAYWRRTHAMHHATSGNLDRRGSGDITTLTVAEYRGRSRWGRFGYRLYRHPIVMFGLGPTYLFLLQHRLPVGLMRHGWRPWLSAIGTDVAIVSAWTATAYFVGVQSLLLVQLPVVLLAGTLGIWLFYVQHQFEHTSWDKAERWNWQKAALYGSSFYDLPVVLRWFTANIGIHHIHHLCGRIPFYRLPNVLRDYPQLRSVSHLTLFDSFRCVRLTLWDEDRRIMIGFRDLSVARSA